MRKHNIAVITLLLFALGASAQEIAGPGAARVDPAVEAFSAARQLERDGDREAASAAYRAVVRDHAGTQPAVRAQYRDSLLLSDPDQVIAAGLVFMRDHADAGPMAALTMLRIGNAYHATGEFDDADQAFATAVQDYSDVQGGEIANRAQFMRAYVRLQRAVAEGHNIVRYRAALAAYAGVTDVTRDGVQARRGIAYIALHPRLGINDLEAGKVALAGIVAAPLATQAEVEDAYDRFKAIARRDEIPAVVMPFISENVRELGAAENGIVWRWYHDIDPRDVTTAEMKTFLETVIRVTPATEDNATLLGKWGSELAKLRM